ncbi:MAG: sialidase family protein [Egibacteraceae bacterium]
MKKSTVRLVLTAFAVALFSQGAATAQESPTLTEPVHATQDDLVPSRTYSSPTLAVDPENDRNIVAAFVEMRTRVCGIMRSTDGGQTWTRPDALPAPASYPFCLHGSGGVTQTPMAFGSEGMLYLGLAGWDEQDGGMRSGNISVLVSRSDDLGESWQTTIARDARGFEDDDIENNRPVSAIAVDTSGAQDTVYVAWRSGSFPTTIPAVAVSTDGGETFSDPIDAKAGFFDDPDNFPDDVPEDQRVAENGGGNNPSMVVDADGTVYVLWERLLSRDVDTEAERNSYVSRSTDRGETWEIFEVAPELPNLGTSIMRWSPEGGADGSLHVAYHAKPDQTQGDADIYYQRSTDAGETWTEPTLISDDDPEALHSQLLPNLEVGPDGRLEAAWWDFRDNIGNHTNDVYHAVSFDNGETWSENRRITDQGIDRSIGPWGGGFDMRMPVGMAVSDAHTIFGYSDTRHGDELTQTQDIYTAALQYEPLPATFPRVLAYVLAAVIGLLFVGLILVAAAFFARRAGGGPPTKPSRGAPEPESKPARSSKPAQKA